MCSGFGYRCPVAQGRYVRAEHVVLTSKLFTLPMLSTNSFLLFTGHTTGAFGRSTCTPFLCHGCCDGFHVGVDYYVFVCD